ncbi:hypothetical protein [Clostridium vincentii]|uniref:Uncharacterized protein n=1 Tax=Clostridium vincentii TaxID=52704 RepID=A0A2T0BIH9_9CLOT|nr:hypothetical protein [Clostridium vincentii]PRR83699.1 hypothetical protein CLVI_06460 [Clostridium vincentii]
MEEINNIINEGQIHLTTNTIILIVAAIIAFFILIKAASGIIKIVAIVGICWFVLMSLQSTNIVNIPIIKETYAAIAEIIPAQELWTKAVEGVDKINNAVSNLK